jgi:WD40 repeat protein
VTRDGPVAAAALTHSHPLRAGRLILGCNSGVYRLSPRVETMASTTDGLEFPTKSWDSQTVVHFGAIEQLAGPIVPTSLAASASGETLLFQDDEGWVVMRANDDRRATRLMPTRDARKGAVSDDWRAAIANWNQGGAAVWDVKSGTKTAELHVGLHGVLQFSPDGQLLAATPDGVTLWRARDWRRINQLHAQGTTPTGLGIAFSPDSRVLAVGQVNGALSLVDPLTGAESARLANRESSAASVMAFSPDQRWLITSSWDERSSAQVWDLETMRRALISRGLDWSSEMLRVTASSRTTERQLEVRLDDGGLLQ